MCVERVEMVQGAKYGRVVFTSPFYIPLFLRGEQFVEFVVEGKQMWGRRYIGGIDGVLTL